MPLQAKLRALDHGIAELNLASRELKNMIKGMDGRVRILEQENPNSATTKEKEDIENKDDDDKKERSDPEKVIKTAENIKAYEKKIHSEHPTIAKTSVLFDIMPCDNETDLEDMLEKVKSISMEGLMWGSSKRTPVGYGIDKMQLRCTLEDDKVLIEELCEKMESFKDLVESAEVSIMNKI